MFTSPFMFQKLQSVCFCWAKLILSAALVISFPLTAASFAHLLLWIFSVIALSIRCCCKGRETTTAAHWGWAFLTEIFFIGTVLQMWYLWEYHGLCSTSYNQCVTIYSIDLILVMLFTLPWYRERTDVAMAIFVFVGVC